MWPDITEQIQRLESLDKNLEGFGAKSHKYRRGPTVSASEIAKVEARLGTTLPSELRDLYLAWGNGGVGPDYGLFSLDDLESVRPDSPWPGFEAVDAAGYTMDSLAGVIAVMDRFYRYRTYIICNGEHRGQIIGFEEDMFVVHEADSLHALYSKWLKGERARLDWYIAAMQSGSDICEIANRSKDHPDNALLICASLLGMEGFTLAEAHAAARWSLGAGTQVYCVDEDVRNRFAMQIERLAHAL